jgi:polysaccharide biosynthesis protein PelC
MMPIIYSTTMKNTVQYFREIISIGVFLTLSGCATTGTVYKDLNMDFGLIQTIAVMPFANLSRDALAGDRVRDVFMTMLQSTGAVYVVPPGEVARGINRAGITNPSAPTPEEVVRFTGNVKADVIILGTVREYGDVRSGTTIANAISMSLMMMEGQTGKVVWTASSTKGGIGTTDRLFGGGGEQMNRVTEKAIDDLLDKLFREKK